MESNGPALQIIKRNKIIIQKCLHGNLHTALDQSCQESMVTDNEYKTAFAEANPVNQARYLVNLMIDKGEAVCMKFLQIVLVPLRSESHPLDEWITVNEEELRGMGIRVSNTENHVIRGEAFRKHINKYKTYLKKLTAVSHDYNALPGEFTNLLEKMVSPVLVHYYHRDEKKTHEFLGRANDHERMMQEANCNGITYEELFDPMKSNGEIPRLVVVVGVPGIGKTTMSKFIVNRLSTAGDIIFDQKFENVIYVRFRELNEIGEVSLKDLLGNVHADLGKVSHELIEDPAKLLFLMDGLDEFGRCLDLSKACNDPNKKTNVEAVIAGLVTGRLLLESSILITTRPLAMEKLDEAKVDRAVEIAGFSADERKSFFHKFYKDNVLGERAYQLLEQNTLLGSLCYNPSFCEMAAITIEDQIKNRGTPEFCPQSTTELFTRYIFVLIKRHRNKAAGEKHIASIAKMALEGVQNNFQIFTQAHLQEFEIEADEVSSTFINNVFKCDGVKRDTCYSFSHLTIQEYFAALSVYLQPTHSFFRQLWDRIRPSKYSVSHILMNINNEQDGRYDVFQRFLCGLASNTPWKILEGVLSGPSAGSQNKVKEWIRHNIVNHMGDKQRLISLLHCVYELQDPKALSNVTRSMTEIDFSHTKLSPLDCIAVSWLLQYRDEPLEKVDVESCGIGTEEIKRLHPGLHKCKALWLGGNDLKNEGVRILANGMKGIDGQLEVLFLIGCSLTVDVGPALQDIIKANKGLRDLRLSGNQIRDADFQLLAHGMARREGRLETLQINYCALTEQSCRAVRNIIRANSCLTSLWLGGNKLKDQGIKLLAEGMAGREGHLKELFLQECLLTSMSGPALHDIIYANPGLRELWLSGNDFRAEEKMELKRRWTHREDLKITF
ncbi:NACHT, LRR and PYD domains-containing protein 3-like [Lampetra fluviatilis]